MTEFLEYNGIRLLNESSAQAVADEVLKNDVYRIGSIPGGSTVFDIGAFYGEFSIACSKKGHAVFAYEPSKKSFDVFMRNIVLNDRNNIKTFNVAVSNFFGKTNYNYNHPPGSKISDEGIEVNVLDINYLIPKDLFFSVAIKLDCEGSENEIFQSLGWLRDVVWLAMEWHNRDGNKYKDLLEKNGFKVEMDSDGESSGGILHARRI